MSRHVLASLATATALGTGAVLAGVPPGGPPPGPSPPLVVRADAAGGHDARSAGRSRVAAGSSEPATGHPSVPAAGPERPGAAPRDAGRWRWPLVPSPPVVRRFRAPPSPYAAGHRGLDLAATAGAPVLAVEDGIVTHRGWVAGRQTLTVHHRDGLESTYEPVAPTVAEGVSVAVGQQLGVLAPPAGADAGHCGARTCLHLGARRGEGYLDPWPLLRGGRVVLLPLR